MFKDSKKKTKKDRNKLGVCISGDCFLGPVSGIGFNRELKKVFTTHTNLFRHKKVKEFDTLNVKISIPNDTLDQMINCYKKFKSWDKVVEEFNNKYTRGVIMKRVIEYLGEEEYSNLGEEIDVNASLAGDSPQNEIQDKKPPKKHIYIDNNILKKIYENLKNKGFSISKISELIDTRFDSLLYYGTSLTEGNFEELKNLVGVKSLLNLFQVNDIPHKIKIGHNEQIILKESTVLAKLIGIMLGDGFLDLNGYVILISLNGIDEEDYVDYVKHLLKKIFPNVRIIERWKREYKNSNPDAKGLGLEINNSAIHNALISSGLVPGNKVGNQIRVPDWIFKNKEFMIGCLRNLFDTDGSTFVKKRSKSIALNFSNGSKNLIYDFICLCNALDIEISQEPTEITDERTGEKIKSYIINIERKNTVKDFLDIIKPKKLRETYRLIYIGVQLIYLNAPSEIKNAIESQIKIHYPKEIDRKYSKKFSIFLKDLCEKHLGYKISLDHINRVIETALEYQRFVYKEEDAKYFAFLFEQLGSFPTIIKYLSDQQMTLIPEAHTFQHHIKKYLEEIENTDYLKWIAEYGFKMITIDEFNKEVLKFPNKIRLFVCKCIFKILNNSSQNLTEKEVLIILKKYFDRENILLFTWLFTKPEYRIPLEKYFAILIKLIKIYINKSEINERMNYTELKKDLNLPFSRANISDIISFLDREY